MATTRQPEHTGERQSRHRARWAAIGAAVAVSFGAGAATVPLAGAITSSGERAVYTAITPCRLADFRADFQVGPRSAPLGPNETETIDARGAQGECSADQLPADAVALQLNVTATDATQRTFLSITPDGSTDTSSLNPVPGAPPTPNAVTVDLAADGTFKIYNLQGNVNVFFDVTGYFTDHNHDDRYDTKDQSDTKIEAAIAAQPWSISIPIASTYWDATASNVTWVIQSGGSSGPTGLRFDSVTSGSTWTGVTVPDDHPAGVPIEIEMLWMAETTNAPGCGAVFRWQHTTNAPGQEWGLDTSLVWDSPNGGNMAETVAIASNQGAATWTDNDVQSNVATISGPGVVPGAHIDLRLSRDHDDVSDTCAGGVTVMGFTVRKAA